MSRGKVWNHRNNLEAGNGELEFTPVTLGSGADREKKRSGGAQAAS